MKKDREWGMGWMNKRKVDRDDVHESPAKRLYTIKTVLLRYDCIWPYTYHR